MSNGDGPIYRPRRRALTPDEVRVWRAVTRDAVPLPGRSPPEEQEETQTMAAPPPPQPRPLTAREPVTAPPRPKAPPPPLAPGITPGLDRRSAERMSKGEMAIDGSIDLHGMTQDLAHAALTGFIQRGYDSGRRCVLVITGKGAQGSGVLKAQVPRWLNQSPMRERILGFSWARPRHGGNGALYVLLKRRRG